MVVPRSQSRHFADERRKELHDLFWWGRIAVGAIATILPVIFVWLLFKDVPASQLIEGTDNVIITKVALSLYYAAWLVGAPADLRMQEKIYLIDPRRGAFPKSFLAITPAFLAAAGLLLWAQKHETYLAITLLCFFAVTTILWFRVKYWALPLIKATREYYELDPDGNFEIEKVGIVRELIIGDWQVYRHSALWILLLAFNAISISPIVRSHVAEWLSVIVPGVSPEAISARLPAFMLLIFVLATEISSWAMRVRAMLSLHIVDRLQRKYFLLRR
jgi:hypothetical protein